MKKLSKLLAMLMVVLTACTLLATTAFATSDGDAVVLGDSMPGFAVSSTDDPMLGVEMVNFDLADYGMRITVPKLDTCLSAVSPVSEGIANIGTNPEGLVASNFLVYDMSSTGNDAVYVQYELTPYTKNFGSFNKLNESDLADQVDAFNTLKCANSSFGVLESVNSEKLGSSVVIRATFTDSVAAENDTRTDYIYTIQNGIAYTIVCRLDGMNTDTGVQRRDQVLNSINFFSPKLGYAFDGSISKGSYGINVFLLIATIVLLILALLLFFFFYRFSAYQKAAGSSFNIFGFDMPGGSDGEDDEYFDEDGDGFDDEHDND